MAETPKYKLDREKVVISEEEKGNEKKTSGGKVVPEEKVDSERTESNEKDSLDHMFDGTENKDDESVADEVQGDDDYQEESHIKAPSNKRKKSVVNVSTTKKILRSSKRLRSDVKTEKIQEPPVVVEIDDEPEDNLPNIIKDFQIKEEFFKENKLDQVYDWIKFQGWDHLFQNEEKVNQKEVMEFYKKARKEEREGVLYLHFEFKGEKMMVNNHQVARMFGLEHTGYDTFNKGTWPKKMSESEKEDIVMRVCNTEGVDKIALRTVQMSTEMKVLHKLLIQNFMPRSTKSSEAQIQDVLILYHIIQKNKVNLPKLMLHQMEYLSKLKDVGYARFIKRILEHQYMYTAEHEVSVMKKLDKTVLEKLFMKFIEGEGWVRSVKPETLKFETVKEERPQIIKAEHGQGLVLNSEQFEKLKTELKSDLVANRREMTSMKNAFKNMLTSFEEIEGIVKQHCEDYDDLARAVKKIAGFIKTDTKGSTSAKSSKV